MTGTAARAARPRVAGIRRHRAGTHGGGKAALAPPPPPPPPRRSHLAVGLAAHLAALAVGAGADGEQHLVVVGAAGHGGQRTEPGGRRRPLALAPRRSKRTAPPAHWPRRPRAAPAHWPRRRKQRPRGPAGTAVSAGGGASAASARPGAGPPLVPPLAPPRPRLREVPAAAFPLLFAFLLRPLPFACFPPD